MNPPSPKEAFQSSKPAVDLHSRTVDNVRFYDAVQASLNQFVHELSPSQNNEQAAANHWRLEGARKLIKVLLTLADPPNLVKPEPAGKLDYNQQK